LASLGLGEGVGILGESLSKKKKKVSLNSKVVCDDKSNASFRSGSTSVTAVTTSALPSVTEENAATEATGATEDEAVIEDDAAMAEVNGSAGATGATGATDVAGANDATGVIGDDGVTGDDGATGDDGVAVTVAIPKAKGKKRKFDGDAGSSIAPVAKKYVYRIASLMEV